MNQYTGFAVITRNGANTMAYTYNIVDDSTGLITKSGIKESFVILDNDLSTHVNAIQTYINNKLNPPVQTGTITTQYIDMDTNTLIEPATIESNRVLGNYVLQAKDFTSIGYVIINSNMQQIALTTTNNNIVVTFSYKKVTGTITMNYLDDNNNILQSATVETGLLVGSHTYNAPIISGGYTANESSLTATITTDNLNPILTFTYSQIKGSLTVKYQNEANNTEITTDKVLSNLDWNDYTENAIDINGYTISGNNTQTVTINADNLNPVIIFTYTQNPVGSVTINYIDDVNSTSIQSETLNNNLALGTYSYDAPEISGYTLSTTDTSSKSVTLTSDNLNQTIEFVYTINPS